jgi:plastocyanin
MHRFASGFAAIAALVLGSACVGTSDESHDHATGTQVEAIDVTISATDRGFDPADVTVARGATVRWINTSQEEHTVTSGASSSPADHPGQAFDRSLAPGQTFDRTFATPGTYPYFCRPHERFGMRGTVTVRP